MTWDVIDWFVSHTFGLTAHHLLKTLSTFPSLSLTGAPSVRSLHQWSDLFFLFTDHWYCQDITSLVITHHGHKTRILTVHGPIFDRRQ